MILSHNQNMNFLEEWGFNHLNLPEPSVSAGRVIEEHKSAYSLITASGLLSAKLPGKFLKDKKRKTDLPVVGDWVTYKIGAQDSTASILEILPRFSLIKRKAAGETQDIQPLAANVNLTFVMTSLNADFNENRLQRYLTIVKDSGSLPYLLLSKADLNPSFAATLAPALKNLNAPHIVVSTITKDGIDEIQKLAKKGITIAILGSSGVGKSSLINALLGEELQATKEVRVEDSKGRHTTTSRKIFRLASGGMIIDTPGLREIQLEEEHESGLAKHFGQIESWAQNCKFSNCQHLSEPKCAVKAALERGELEEKVLAQYQKLAAEIRAKAKKY